MPVLCGAVRAVTGKHLSWEEVSKLVAPSPDAVAAVMAWLSAYDLPIQVRSLVLWGLVVRCARMWGGGVAGASVCGAYMGDG